MPSSRFEGAFWQDGLLQIYGIDSDRQGYQQMEQSRLLSDLLIGLFCRYATYHDQFDAVDEFLRAIS